MKKRKLLKKGVACLLIAGMPLTSLTSCGFGLFSSGSTAVNTITGIETGVDAYGNIVITITFSNMDPVTISIPMGSQGSDGTGIEAITYTQSSDGNSTIVTITYTDPDKDPDVIEIPNGSTLTRVETYTDSTGLSTIVFYFQVGDQEYTWEFTVPKGDTGAAGVGIKEIYTYPGTEDGQSGVYLVFYLTNDSYATVFIPTGGKGDTGRGISTITAYTEGEYYILVITYTDNSSETIQLPKPADGCTWYTGNGLSGRPSSENAKEGDFYFDLEGTTIYLLQNGQWVVVVTFTTEQTKHLVQFDLNDNNDGSASMPTASVEKVEENVEDGEGEEKTETLIDNYTWVYPYQAYIFHNSYFNTSTNGYGEIPIPTRDSYTFKGWCTSQEPTVVSGYLTDTTPILTDLYLYAIWEQ